MKENLTIVTALFNIGRGEMGGDFKREFSLYMEKFKNLLRMTEDGYNFCIYCDKEVYDELCFAVHLSQGGELAKRVKWVVTDLSKFTSNFFPFYNDIQKIRRNPKWGQGAAWLEDSPQKKLQYYNPVIMSKMFFLHETLLINPFKSDYFVWLDAGILNTVSKEQLSQIDKCEKYLQDFLMIEFPYENDVEIHGFKTQNMTTLCGQKPKGVCRGGFFGSHKKNIKSVFSLYYNLLQESLTSIKDLGTEENILTAAALQAPNLIRRAKIEGNGLIGKFFDDVKDDSVTFEGPKVEKKDVILGKEKVDVYVIGFELPKQLEIFFEGYEDFFDRAEKINDKIFVDNSATEEYRDAFKDICAKNSFLYRRTENLGICGAREWVAKEFFKCSSDYYVCFEDDMLFSLGLQDVEGNREIDKGLNIWSKSIDIMTHEGMDFLKLNFDEVYGDNSKQWAFINMDKQMAEKYYPGVTQIEQNIPDIKNHCLRYMGEGEDKLLYSISDAFYCNWPLMFSKSGNSKVFLEGERKALEQFWMKKVFILQKKEQIKTGVILKNLNTHDRRYYYHAELRKES